MQGITVTPAQLASLAATVNSTSADINSGLANLTRQLSVLNGAWSGVAAGQFDALWREWHTSATHLNQALAGISQLLRQAGSAYEDAESHIAQSFRH